jgi:hypothetical protein
MTWINFYLIYKWILKYFSINLKVFFNFIYTWNGRHMPFGRALINNSKQWKKSLEFVIENATKKGFNIC